MTSSENPLRAELARWALRSLVGGAVGLIVCLIGGLLAPAAFFPAYLAAHQYFLGIGLGCLVLLMIYHLTGGAWGFVLRRILEAGSRTLPVSAALFLPLGFGLAHLFPWARPELAESSESLRHQQPYMNMTFFWIRVVSYYAIWIGTALALNYWSRRQDAQGEPGPARRLATLSAVGLIAYGITIHFASIDWLMALQPAFRSTIFGPLVGSGQVLTAQALAVLVLALLLRRTALGEYASPPVLNDLGNLLLTFLVIFAYMVYFQYMLVWIANLRHEVIWFLPRTRGGWGILALVLIVLHLGVPFFLLLMRDIKRRPPVLAAVAALLLGTHLVYCFHRVLPVFPDAGAWHLLDVAAVVGVGGVWLASFLWELRRAPLAPPHDPSREIALHLIREEELEAGAPEELAHA